MLQMIWKLKPEARVAFGLVNSTDTLNLAATVDRAELVAQLDHARTSLPAQRTDLARRQPVLRLRPYLRASVHRLSQPPVEAADELIASWRARGRDPREKLVILSDAKTIRQHRGERGRLAGAV